MSGGKSAHSFYIAPGIYHLLDNGILHLINTKGGKYRFVPMSEGMADIVVRYCMAMGLYGKKNGWLLPSSKGDRAVEYVQLSEELETRFMVAVKRMKQAFNLCSSSEKLSDEDKDYIHFYCALRSILFKLTKGEAPDIAQMNVRVREMLEGAIQSDGIEELFETGKYISVDIFSDEYMDKINAIQLPNTKIKILQRLLSQAIDEFRKVNKIMGMEFDDRLKRVVDEYNNRRDEAYANEVLDDVAEQLA